MQPAHHIEAVRSCLSHEGPPWPQGTIGRIQSAGEEWPDAYRYTPMRPDEAEACSVIWWHPVWNCVVAQRCYGVLFWTAERGHIVQQIGQAGGSFGQGTFAGALVHVFRRCHLAGLGRHCGGRSEVRQPVSRYDGMQHGLTKSRSPAGSMANFSVFSMTSRMYHPEPFASGAGMRSSQKVADSVELARLTGLHRGMAAKLYGISDFLETGMLARVGQAGPRSSSSVTFFRLQPRLAAGSFDRRLWASDAACENGSGSAELLAVTNPGKPNEARVGGANTIPSPPPP